MNGSHLHILNELSRLSNIRMRLLSSQTASDIDCTVQSSISLRIGVEVFLWQSVTCRMGAIKTNVVRYYLVKLASRDDLSKHMCKQGIRQKAWFVQIWNTWFSLVGLELGSSKRKTSKSLINLPTIFHRGLLWVWKTAQAIIKMGELPITTLCQSEWKLSLQVLKIFCIQGLMVATDSIIRVLLKP